jgi:hypothetical protein
VTTTTTTTTTLPVPAARPVAGPVAGTMLRCRSQRGVRGAGRRTRPVLVCTVVPRPRPVQAQTSSKG